MRFRSVAPLALVLLATVGPAAALTPHLVKDINPIPASAGSDPKLYTTVGGVAFFFADDSLTGREVWRTDGTAAGTFQILDACPGPCSGDPIYVAHTQRSYFFNAVSKGSERELWVSGGLPSNTFRLTGTLDFLNTGTWSAWVAAQGLVFFAADDGIHGTELWRTDGTRTGTFMVADLLPGPDSSYPNEMMDVNGRLFCRAYSRDGNVLWKSDGTAAGTQLVRDPPPSWGSRSDLILFLRAAAGRTLFFLAPGKKGDTQLWKSDGTAAGTVPLARARSLRFFDFSVFGNRLIFVASTPARGQELWVSDGTERGTQPLTRLPRADAFQALDGRFGVLPLPRFSLGNRFLFLADDGPHGVELWTTDGTRKGTRLVRDLCPGSCAGAGSQPVIAGDRAFFTGSDGIHGWGPWSTDGTAAGTRMSRELCSGDNCRGSLTQWRAGKGRAFFVRRDDAGGLPQLWSTDGTAQGTVPLTIDAQAHVAPYLESTLLAGSLLFTADDPAFGPEPWISDGTPQGTRLVADVHDGDGGGSRPHDLKAAGGKVYFFADDGQHDAHTLWVSDGTEAGTSLLADPFAGRPFSAYSRPAIFAAAAAGGQAFLTLGVRFPETYQIFSLWRSDGTAAGTVRLTPETVQVDPSQLEAMGNQVFFSAYDAIHGTELWVSDGTVGGTRMAADLEKGDRNSWPLDLTAFQGRLYFSAQVEGLGRELWRSDGTPEGTVLVKDLHPLQGSAPHDLTEHAGKLYFAALDGDDRQQIWSTDGTAAGTVRTALFPSTPDAFIASLVSAGSKLFFWTVTPDSTRGLWVSDGTAAGERISSAVGSRPVVFNGEIYFESPSPLFIGTTNLWKSDGTKSGTTELLAQNGHSFLNPFSLQVFAGRLVFTGQLLYTTNYGVLYQSDGTQAGTSKLLDLRGPSDYYDFDLAPAGPRLLFRKWDHDDGSELWALEAE